MQKRIFYRSPQGPQRKIGHILLRQIIAVVVYIEWEDEETIRILSARKATKREGKEYLKRIAD